MYQLLRFFSRLKIFITFLILEIICSWLIVNNNTYQQAAFLSSANALAGNAYQMRDALTGQFNLRNEIEILQNENATLLSAIHTDSTVYDSIQSKDSIKYGRFNYIPARIINNTIDFDDNYLTIDKGTLNGIKPGMGVISPNGIVGRIKTTTGNFAAVYSLLHSNIRVSAQIKKTKDLCTVKWNAEGTDNDFSQAELLFIPIHVDIQVGDTIETSGYNTVYPEGINIGKVNKVEEDLTEGRKKVTIDLLVNFSNIKNVYIIENYDKGELESLQNSIQTTPIQ